MKTREETARFIENQLNSSNRVEKHYRYHYGYLELKKLMDFVYESPPNKEEELNLVTYATKEKASH